MCISFSAGNDKVFQISVFTFEIDFNFKIYVSNYSQNINYLLNNASNIVWFYSFTRLLIFLVLAKDPIVLRTN